MAPLLQILLLVFALAGVGGFGFVLGVKRATTAESTLLACVTRLEAAAAEGKQIAGAFEVNLALWRRIADRDRVQLDRMEEAAVGVAADLVESQKKVAGVASDLAASHSRAAAVDGSPGEAADAAARPGEPSDRD